MSGPDRIITIINSIPQPWQRIIVTLMEERDKAKSDLANREALAALPEVQAIVAAALERAAKYLDTHAIQSVSPSAVPTPIGDAGWSHDGMKYAKHIRALTPADASAALEAIVADAVEIARANAFVLGREAGEKAEREACATVADEYHAAALAWAKNIRGLEDIAETDSSRIAAAIRKRGEG
jgi:hypothetical protein